MNNQPLLLRSSFSSSSLALLSFQSPLFTLGLDGFYPGFKHRNESRSWDHGSVSRVHAQCTPDPGFHHQRHTFPYCCNKAQEMCLSSTVVDVFVERSFSFYGPVISNGADAEQIPHCETRD